MDDITTPPPAGVEGAAPMDDRIEDLQIEKELADSYLTYAMSTIMDRALPDVRDGLKPSQRRILVAMNDLNLLPGRKHLKCAKICGDTSGNYHPHGDAVIYPALVRMAQEWSLPDLINVVPGPDFPTGGVICGKDGIVEGYKTGRGRLTLRARIKVEQPKGGKEIIVIEELPYGIIRKTIVEAVGECVKKEFIKDIAACNDHSGREHAVRIVIDLKRDADPNVVINQLYQYTPCQITVSMINIALVNRQPRTMGLKELIQHFIDHRREVITRRTKHLLKKAQQREHILEGTIFAVCDIDEVIRLIRSSKTRDEAIEKLMAQGFRIHPNSDLAKKLPSRITLRHPEIFAAESGAQVRPFRVSRAQAE